ncbi:MAG: GGDEF domain-containing phosphodiesterase, partial [Thermoanaerobaculia bacterium]|nr:GGDEF domain-containing phosphodiesterase [Thermoanaerobaculia bacterium]
HRINESGGLRRGDRLLGQVADIAVAAAGRGGLVGRVGGDVFALVLAGPHGEAEAARIAGELIEKVASIGFDGEGPVAASVGIAVCPRDARDPATLLLRGESAMRRAKALGGGRCRFFSQPLPDWSRGGLSLECRLRRAMDQNRLEVYFQPIREASGRSLVGAEALLRWHDPERGWIPPCRFIPVAEETGLILPLGDWVLRTAGAQWQRWMESGLADFPVSINFSGRQLRYPKQVHRVAEALHDLGLAPRSLRVEITEGSILQDTSATVSSLEVLTRMGIRLSLDDFGTGYSSLKMLRRIPFTHVKIGGCFVREIDAHREVSPLPAAIIGLAHSLGQRVVAEGVETADQLEYLLEHGCDELQGRLLGREMPPAEFESLLGDERVMAQQLTADIASAAAGG